MILTCPACSTQYRLKDGAIPPEGRTVRCASCKHKWHQDGDGAAATASTDSDETVGQWPVTGVEGGNNDLGGPPQPDSHAIEPERSEPTDAAIADEMIAETPEPMMADPVEQTSVEEPVAASEWAAPNQAYPVEEQGFEAIPAMRDEAEPRGGMLKWIAALVVLVIAAAAAFWFLAPPELKARAGIAQAGESPLEVIVTTKDRQRLASGNELLAISGRVINSTEQEQAVPPIKAELRDAQNKMVYQWIIPPPARSLAPGAAASFNSAEVDVPAGADVLSLRFAG